MTPTNIFALRLRAAFCFVACCVADVCCQFMEQRPACAANIELGSATLISGVTPSGSGTQATPWVYNYSGATLSWGTDTAFHNGVSWTTFTNIAHVTSGVGGGTVNKGNSDGAGAIGPTGVSVGDLRFELNAGGTMNLNGFLSTRYRSTGTAGDGGNLYVFAPGAIAINGVQTFTSGQASQPAGLNAGSWSIMTNAKQSSGSVELYTDGNVTLAGGVNTSNGDSANAGIIGGSITIRGTTGPSTRAGVISIGGDVLRLRSTASTQSGTAGPISILSSGNVTVAGNIRTYSRQNSLQTNGSQIASALTIDSQGDVSINGSTGIELTITSTAFQNTNFGGNASIVSGGDINIAGGFDLRNLLSPTVANHGTLSLAADGTISVGTLNISNVRYAGFAAGDSESFIVGALANFDSSVVSGTGSVLDPIVNSQTFLRADAGQVIYYNYVAAGLNDYLGGKTYRLADLSGNAGLGGLLSFETVSVPEPSTYALAIIGLAVLGFVRSRKRG